MPACLPRPPHLSGARCAGDSHCCGSSNRYACWPTWSVSRPPSYEWAKRGDPGGSAKIASADEAYCANALSKAGYWARLGSALLVDPVGKLYRLPPSLMYGINQDACLPSQSTIRTQRIFPPVNPSWIKLPLSASSPPPSPFLLEEGATISIPL